MFLSELGIPIHYTAKDAESDLKTFKQFLRK